MVSTQLQPALVDLLLAVADDKLLLGHRNSDWTGLGPILEEDIAFSSLAQDEIAHAQALYELVERLDGRSPDALAFGRTPAEFRCAAIVEGEDGFDWARAIARQLFCDHFDHLRLERLAASSWAPLAALARRLAAEEQVHVDHVDAWILRLGRGSTDSRERLQAAIDELSPLASGLFEPVAREAELESSGLYPAPSGAIYPRYAALLADLGRRAGLRIVVPPDEPGTLGGRRGRHGPALAALLDEMGEVYRIEPGARW